MANEKCKRCGNFYEPNKNDEKTNQCEKGQIMNDNTLRAVGIIGIIGITGIFVSGVCKVVKLVLNN